MTGLPGEDPFGLYDLDVDLLRQRAGAKWHRPAGRLAAWVADMDFPVAPAIRDRLHELLDPVTGDLGYPDWLRPVRSPLPELFVERMGQRYRWDVEIDRVVELADVVQGVQMAVHHLTRPGDGVVLHTPAYPPFFAAVEGLGRRVVRVPWPFDPDRLAVAMAEPGVRVLLLCHPHNPTGHVFGRDELERMAALAERHDITVVSDEIHADLTHAPARHLPFAALDAEVATRTVTLTSASKAFNLAGLRWAALHAGSDDMLGALRSLPDHYLGAPNLPAVVATEAAWTAGDGWLTAVLAVLDENRRRLVDLLAARLPEVEYRMPAATYLAWLDCRRLGWGDDPSAEFTRRGVELSPGPSFGHEGIGHVRLNFATSPGVLGQILAAMATGGVPDRAPGTAPAVEGLSES